MTAHTPDKRPAYEPAARLLKPTGYDPDMPRPTSTAAGVGLVFLGVIAQALVYVFLALGWDDVLGGLTDVALTPEVKSAALWFVLGTGGAVLLLEIVLAVLIYRGRNWPRVLVMILTVFSIVTAFTAWWAQGQAITVGGTFVSLALDILVLLALSSRSASAYARRNERR